MLASVVNWSVVEDTGISELRKSFRNTFPIVMMLILHFLAVTNARSPIDKNRYDTSLGLLTKKFVGLLRSAEDGVCTVYI